MKFKSLKTVMASLLLSTTCLVNIANATLIYSVQATFNAQLSTSITDDYSNTNYTYIQDNASMSAVLGETDYTPTAHLNSNLVPNQFYCAGCNGSFSLDFTTTTIGTLAGVFGVGFDINHNDSQLAYDVFITFGDSSTLSVDLGVGSRFFGITDTKLIKSVPLGLADGFRIR